MLSFDSRRVGDCVIRPMGGLRRAPATSMVNITVPVGVVLWRGRLPLGAPASRFDGRTLPALCQQLLPTGLIPAEGGRPAAASANDDLTPDAHSSVWETTGANGRGIAEAAQGGISLAPVQAGMDEGIGGDEQFVSANGNAVRPAVYQHEQSYEQQGFFAWGHSAMPPRCRPGA